MNRLQLYVIKTRARRMASCRGGCKTGNREAARLRTLDQLIGFYFDHLPGIVRTRQIEPSFIRQHFATETGDGDDFLARYRQGVVVVSERKETELTNDPVVSISGNSRCRLVFEDGKRHRVFVRDGSVVEILSKNSSRVLVSAYDDAEIISTGDAETRVVLHGNTATHIIKNHGENKPSTKIKKY